MAKATENSNGFSALTQTPGSAVLTSLVGRLRSHAKAINNAAARQTVGKDLKAAADVIEQLLADMPVEVAAAVAMVALLGRNGFAAYTGGRRDV
jgi:hypothetical protein